MLGASGAAEIARWVLLSLGGDDVGCKGGGKSSRPLGAFPMAVILGARRKGVMQNTAQRGSNEQLQEGKQNLLASKMHS